MVATIESAPGNVEDVAPFGTRNVVGSVQETKLKLSPKIDNALVILTQRPKTAIGRGRAQAAADIAPDADRRSAERHERAASPGAPARREVGVEWIEGLAPEGVGFEVHYGLREVRLAVENLWKRKM